MKIIGLTGGIGSGKTFVSKLFAKKGIPVYYADDEAKLLMTKKHDVVVAVKELFGDDAYKDGMLNRKHISNIVFNNKSILKKLNAIVHPAVKQHFAEWVKLTPTSTPYVIKEAAILFESKTNSDCSFTIAISAPEELRLERVMKRDLVDRISVLNRINKQLTDEERNKLADFIIFTDNKHNVEEQVDSIHSKIIG